MNTYKRMYVLCEDEYRRLLEDKEAAHIEKVVAIDAPPQEQCVIAATETKKRYKCALCEKDYSDKHDLRRHINNNHTKKVSFLEEEIKQVQPDIIVNNKVRKRKRRPPPRDPFSHIIKTWKTL